jgi:hypothetical protein
MMTAPSSSPVFSDGRLGIVPPARIGDPVAGNETALRRRRVVWAWGLRRSATALTVCGAPAIPCVEERFPLLLKDPQP